MCLEQCRNHDSNANVRGKQLKGKKPSMTCQSTLTHVDCTLHVSVRQYSPAIICLNVDYLIKLFPFHLSAHISDDN